MSVAVENGTARPENESTTTTTSEEGESDPHFEPVVVLPEVEVSTNEENEEEMIKLRAKLFRFDSTDPDHLEWKERGTGEVKLLRHKENNSVRVVMRRDRTLKICANHFITPWTELKPSRGSNRAWVWTVPADFADETAKTECLAIRFASAEIALQWKNKFEEAKRIIIEKCDLYKSTSASNLSGSGDESDQTNDENKENQQETEQQQQQQQPKEKEEDDTVITKMADLNVTN